MFKHLNCWRHDNGMAAGWIGGIILLSVIDLRKLTFNLICYSSSVWYVTRTSVTPYKCLSPNCVIKRWSHFVVSALQHEPGSIDMFRYSSIKLAVVMSASNMLILNDMMETGSSGNTVMTIHGLSLLYANPSLALETLNYFIFWDTISQLYLCKLLCVGKCKLKTGI